MMLEVAVAAMISAAEAPASFRRLPECADATSPVSEPCVLPIRLSEREAVRLLGKRAQLHWLSGDQLTLVARFGPEGWGLLCCSIQTPLRPMGSTGIGAITIRVPHVDNALLDAGMAGAETQYPAERVATSRPPRLPSKVMELRGTITRHLFRSPNLDDEREVTVYVPPDLQGDEQVPVIYLADGETERFAKILEAGILEGRTAPAMIVGLAAGRSTLPGCDGTCGRRTLEYLISAAPKPGQLNPLFDPHMRFVTEEVIPMVERDYPASADREGRMVAGYSNGGAWAVTAAELRPDLFGRVLVMSMAGGPWPVERASALKHARVFGGAGIFERLFLPRTREMIAAAHRVGASTKMQEVLSGHSSLTWEILFAQGAEWLLPPKNGNHD